MRKGSMEMVLAFITYILETGWASLRSAVALMQDLQELCIYNNGKHWTLKQYQVTCNFAPPRTTGQPTPHGRGLPYGAPYPHAQLVP